MPLYARRVLFACLVLLWMSGAASAQTAGTFALGLDVGTKVATHDGATGHPNVGVLWRFGHGRDGWGWEYGLSWYSAELEQPIADIAPTGFGELHVRPILGGYGYSRRAGRHSVSAKLLGGYAFNSFELHPSFDDTYRQRLGATSVTTDASNGFVLKPELSAWVDLGRKIGLRASAAYMVSRPGVTVTSSLGRDHRHINADVLMLKIGAVYSIF